MLTKPYKFVSWQPKAANHINEMIMANKERADKWLDIVDDFTPDIIPGMLPKEFALELVHVIRKSLFHVLIPRQR